MRGMLLSVMVAFACVLMAMPAKAETRPAPTQAVGPGKDCAECPEMVRIPGRSFLAGKHEVTFAEWDACVAGGGCNGYRPEDRGWGRGRRPVTNVSWNDAQAYVQWLSNKTGKRYRLLTSEEWEFAARAGTTTEYSWGNEEPACNESARNGANFAACPDNRTRQLAHSRQTGLACTMCMAMWRSGLRIVMMATALAGSCAVVRGSAALRASARRSAAGAIPRSATTSWGFVWRGHFNVLPPAGRRASAGDKVF